MSRFNYGHGRGKVGFRPKETPAYAPLPPDIYSEPREVDDIFGARLHSWFWAETTNDVTLSGSKVSAWVNRTGREDAVQATDALRPTWDPHGFGPDRPGLLGTGTQYLLTGAMAEPIALGTRPYMIAVGRCDEYDDTLRRLFDVATSAGDKLSIRAATTFAGVNARMFVDGGVDGGASALAAAGAIKIFEMGVLATTARKLVVSRVSSGLVTHPGASGTLTGATSTENDRIGVMATANGLLSWKGGIAELIVLTEPPTTDELDEVRRRLIARRYELS